MRWPADRHQLEALQLQLAQLRPPPWRPSDDDTIGGCFVCFGRGGGGRGAGGDPGWAAAVTMRGNRAVAEATTTGKSGAGYAPGLLASREGPMLDAAVRALRSSPEVLLVNATGLDHPRRAGLALHLGWVLEVPTVGITHRPLCATGTTPEGDAPTPLRIGGEQVGWWVRTAAGARPVAVSPGWRTDLESSLPVVLAATGRFRTPEPLRRARHLARRRRSREPL